MRSRHLSTALVLAVALFSCSSDSPESGTTTTSASGNDSTTVQTDAALAVVAGEVLPEERCAANEAAGTITFLTGFDYAATSSIIDVITADGAGYYDDLCLDVEIRPGFSAANYPQVASGTAQFASGGSFSPVR